jgi:hypothetical protein
MYRELEEGDLMHYCNHNWTVHHSSPQPDQCKERNKGLVQYELVTGAVRKEYLVTTIMKLEVP